MKNDEALKCEDCAVCELQDVCHHLIRDGEDIIGFWDGEDVFKLKLELQRILDELESFDHEAIPHSDQIPELLRMSPFKKLVLGCDVAGNCLVMAMDDNEDRSRILGEIRFIVLPTVEVERWARDKDFPNYMEFMLEYAGDVCGC